MSFPLVSFVVPCYRLAHYLPQCVGSILGQTYSDFEILIMDDCSPDSTRETAEKFRDPRIRYVRNEHNLGNLANYNKGINLSRGQYVWLISADDYLRKAYALETYVRTLDRHPTVGYTCSPGVVVRNEQEAEIVHNSRYVQRDRIVKGHQFLRHLVKSNFVIAASAMVRRECYMRIGLFPQSVPWLDRQVSMRWVGDWYLWCMFALQYDVAYFAEPMVCYRDHELSMTSTITREPKSIQKECASSDIAVAWVIRQKALEAGRSELSKGCLRAAANALARHATTLGIGGCEEALRVGTADEGEREWVRARMFEAMGDISYWRNDLSAAKKFYRAGLRSDPIMARAHAKLMLLALGQSGDLLRSILRFGWSARLQGS